MKQNIAAIAIVVKDYDENPEVFAALKKRLLAIKGDD